MKITSVKNQVKNPNRASIFIDGEYSFSLSLDELVACKLKPGLEIDSPRLKELKRISTDGKARARALEWVMNRPRSLLEFNLYMKRKEVDDRLVDKIRTEFVSRGYLDDLRFANWLVDVRQRGGRSNKAIAAELYQKGVDRTTVNQVIDTAKDDLAELGRLKAMYLKKKPLTRYQKNPDKLIQYLLRKGFNYDGIKKVMLDSNDSNV